MEKYRTVYDEVEVSRANDLIKKYESEGYVVKDILSAYMKPGVRHLGITFIKDL